MNAIRITKFSETGSKVLSLTETVRNDYKTRRITLGELPTVIQENFGMPPGVVREAISIIKELKDIYD